MTTRNFVLGWMGLGMMTLVACGGSVETEDGVGGEGGDAAVTTAAQTTAQTSGTGKSSATAGPSTGTTNGTATSGGTGTASSSSTGVPPSPICQKMALLQLSNPILSDAGGDMVWSPGETALVQVTMTNPSAEDNFDYPGVAASADHADVTTSGNTLFGIFAGQSTDVTVGVQADAGMVPGTVVDVTIAVTALNEVCAGLDSVSLQLTVAP